MPSLLIFVALTLRDGECLDVIRNVDGPAPWSQRDPVRQAKILRIENTRALHIVDLDLAEEHSARNRAAIEAIARAEGVRIPIQVCGGIRDISDARELLEQRGADRIALGSAALEQPSLIRTLISEYGPKKIVIAIEARDNRTHTQNGQVAHDISPLEHARHMKRLGVERILYTDLDAVHGRRTIDIPAVTAFAVESGMSLTVNGGVATYKELAELASALPRRIDSVVLGSALYMNRFACQGLWRKAEERLYERGLLPT
ncbi:MAG: tRNA-dihydrouridine synthase [Ignavibacteriae bacterium]|nr:tRNA-dihydrouridine synthase [Ignavibacteriota bacterium]